MKNKVFTVKENIACTELGDEKVLLNLDDGKYLALNQSGSIIFEHFDGQKTICQITDDICKKYDLKTSDVEEDIISFSKSLLKKKIIF